MPKCWFTPRFAFRCSSHFPFAQRDLPNPAPRSWISHPDVHLSHLHGNAYVLSSGLLQCLQSPFFTPFHPVLSVATRGKSVSPEAINCPLPRQETGIGKSADLTFVGSSLDSCLVSPGAGEFIWFHPPALPTPLPLSSRRESGRSLPGPADGPNGVPRSPGTTSGRCHTS